MGVRFPPGAPHPDVSPRWHSATQNSGYAIAAPGALIRSADPAVGFTRGRISRSIAWFNARKRRRVHACRSRNRRFVQEYPHSHPCVDCGIADPLVLEFDHVRGNKRTDISSLVHAATALGLLQDEIRTCVVRCPNCHRRKTAMTLWGRCSGGFSSGDVPVHPLGRGDCSSAG